MNTQFKCMGPGDLQKCLICVAHARMYGLASLYGLQAGLLSFFTYARLHCSYGRALGTVFAPAPFTELEHAARSVGSAHSALLKVLALHTCVACLLDSPCGAPSARTHA